MLTNGYVFSKSIYKFGIVTNLRCICKLNGLLSSLTKIRLNMQPEIGIRKLHSLSVTECDRYDIMTTYQLQASF